MTWTLTGSPASRSAAAGRHGKRRCRVLPAALALVGVLAAPPQVTAQEQQEHGIPGKDQGHATGSVLGVQGYYEVTPSGAVILYPSTPVTAPGVMHTILGMFGGTSMIGKRGFFQITPRGELFLYFPPGVTWSGMGGPQPMPGMPGAVQGTVQ